MEDLRKMLVKSIIGFLIPEVNSGKHSIDQREAIEVAIQCLETAYSVEGGRSDPDTINLLELFEKALELRKTKEITDEDKAKAEALKTEGNDAMRVENFSEAIEKYSKAIDLNPNNAVYFCNRAAALSRLNKHQEAIEDCQTAVKLDPNYSKAYGRLGIAYSNLQNYEEAKKAYARAVELDPNNTSYKQNLHLAEQQQQQQPPPPSQRRSPGRSLDFAQLINNPNVVNIASQMMNDPAFRNVVTGIMSTEGRTPHQNINVLFQAGQEIAAQVEATNPTLVENLRRSLHPENADDEEHQTTESESKHDDIE